MMEKGGREDRGERKREITKGHHTWRMFETKRQIKLTFTLQFSRFSSQNIRNII
jgi:hypothetical protein